jgi:hypothetical protein
MNKENIDPDAQDSTDHDSSYSDGTDSTHSDTDYEPDDEAGDKCLRCANTKTCLQCYDNGNESNTEDSDFWYPRKIKQLIK